SLRNIDATRERSVQMRHKLLVPGIVSLGTAFGLLVFSPSYAAEQAPEVPAWLESHVGEGPSQIAQVVLQRARALYLQKVSEGTVKNPCYFAMDATRPGGSGRRFYTICEADHIFRAVPTGHGNAHT